MEYDKIWQQQKYIIQNKIPEARLIVQGRDISSNTEHQLAAVHFLGLLINTRSVLGKNTEVRVNNMKATMLIIVAGLMGPQEAEFDTMEACLKQAPIVKKQSAIKDVACIPSSNRNWVNLNDLDIFLQMLDAIKERTETWPPYINNYGLWEE